MITCSYFSKLSGEGHGSFLEGDWPRVLWHHTDAGWNAYSCAQGSYTEIYSSLILWTPLLLGFICWRVVVFYYRPQTKFAKVMFLHLSVSHSVHKGGIQAHTQGGSWGVSRPIPRGEVGGVSRPTPRGEVGWSGQGGLQAHTRGSDGSQQAATAAGGTHPTGMHSCFILIFCRLCWRRGVAILRRCSDRSCRRTALST